MSERTEPRLWWRCSEFAEMVQLSEPYVYRLAAAGVIPSVRIGRAVRIPVEAGREWAERQARTTAATP